MNNLSELVKKVEECIQKIIEGRTTQYINFTDENDTIWTVRIANHGANPSRINDNTISLVLELPEYESDEYSEFCIRKKKFQSVSNQFYLNEMGDFTENFMNIEECLEYVIN